MLKYSLFLGCYIPSMQPFAEIAFRKIAPQLDLELKDIEGATCCPVPEIVRLIDHDTWLVVAARNLALAEELGNDILVMCNGCWETLHEARSELLHDEKLREQINSFLKFSGKSFKGTVKVKHYSQVLAEDVGVERIRENVKVDLSNINVAVHPGCKLYKCEGGKAVKYMLEIVEALGVNIVDYGIMRVCCGYPLMLASVDKAIHERTKWKLDAMKKAGAEMIVVACPACYDQFEKAELALKDEGLEYNLPVIHLSELIALAFGFSPKEIGLDLHGVPFNHIFKELEGVL